MAIPKTIDTAREHLFSDKADMIRAGVPDIIQDRIMRLRNTFTQWVNNCYLQDKDIVQYLMEDCGVSQSTAYEDIRIVKQLLGDVNAAKKSYHRWQFNENIKDLIVRCRADGDFKTEERAIATYARYNQLEQPDEQDVQLDKIPIQPFDITTNPEVIGIEPIPNLHAHISKMNKKFADDITTISDAEYKDVNENKEKEDEQEDIL